MFDRIYDSDYKIKNYNKLQILKTIKIYGPISRTEIMEKTGIPLPSVSRLTDELLKEGLIFESGNGESSGGRKPIYLEINSSSNCIIGINIHRMRTKLVLMNMEAAPIDRVECPVDFANFDFDILIDQLIQHTYELIKRNKVDKEKILGIGISVYKPVDSVKGISYIIDEGYPLREVFEDKIGIFTLINNNAKAQALGEYWYGVAKGYEHVMYVIVDRGIGSGIIINGRLIEGMNNVSGEIGHMIVNLDGERCSCGNYGCLEAYSSVTSIEKRIKAKLKAGRKSMLLDMVRDDIEKVDYDMISKAAEEGDELCRQVITDAAVIFGTALYNLVMIFNPDIIVVNGDGVNKSDLFFDISKEAMESKVHSKYAKGIKYVKSILGEDAGPIGAGALLLREIFEFN